MPASEWALTAFTLLAQASVGLWLVSGFWPGSRPGEGGAAVGGSGIGRLRLIFRRAALAAMLAGTGISLLHLGRPLQAARALHNLAGSWLSREILFALIFVLGMVFHLAATTGGIRRAGWKASYLATAAAGSILILIMARLYMLPSVPVWNHVATPLSFLGAMGLMGILGGAALAESFGGFRSGTGDLSALGRDARNQARISVAARGLILLQVLLSGDTVLRARMGGGPFPEGNVDNPTGILIGMGLRAVFGITVFFLLTRVSARLRRGDSRGPGTGFEWRLIFTFALGGEICGRALFYALFSRLGI